jgi:hypothetical protein
MISQGQIPGVVDQLGPLTTAADATPHSQPTTTASAAKTPNPTTKPPATLHHTTRHVPQDGHSLGESQVLSAVLPFLSTAGDVSQLNSSPAMDEGCGR